MATPLFSARNMCRLSAVAACVCGSACAHAVADSRALVNVPIAHFSVPGFDSNGHRKWEISGTSATMEEDNLFSVQSAKISCFSENMPWDEVFSATSDGACIIPRLHMVRGTSGVRIVGQKFSASAGAWEFFGDLRKIIASGGVEVFIDCSDMWHSE